MKFTINAKSLDTAIGKVMTTIDKKASLPSLTKIYIEIRDDGTLLVSGGNMEHFVTIRSDCARDTSPGRIVVDIEDTKAIKKMNGEINIEGSENVINIHCGKKSVSILNYSESSIDIPDTADAEKIFTTKESWLLETLSSLNMFTIKENTNKLMTVFHFNTLDQRIEALDGFRMGMRQFEQEAEYKTNDLPNHVDNLKLSNICVPVFKKIMSNKSDNILNIYQNKKYIRIEGNDFTYIIRRIDGVYFNVGQIIKKYSCSFRLDREDILSVVKYNNDLSVKGDKNSMILYYSENKLYSYFENGRYKCLDKIDIMETFMDNTICVGFNTQYLTDAFSLVDSENPTCELDNNKSPMMIYGNEYSFLILPVRIEDDYIAKIKEYINKERVA